MFRQMAVERHKLADALAQAGNAIVLGTGDDNRSARPHTLNRLSDAQFVSPAMTAGKHQCRIETFAFQPRGDREARPLQRAKMRAEALHQMQCRIEACGQAETRFSAEKEDTLALTRQGDSLGLERMEQCLQRLGGHSSISKCSWLV